MNVIVKLRDSHAGPETHTNARLVFRAPGVFTILYDDGDAVHYPQDRIVRVVETKEDV